MRRFIVLATAAMAMLLLGPARAFAGASVRPPAGPEAWGSDPLYRLPDAPTRMVNSLWGENPKERQFGDGRTRVVLADLKGPGVITMIHFALPQNMKLDRQTILRIYWDGEKSPSVESPLTDFFCDPNGALERVETVLTNKKRGWNCYFPMPFAKSARVVLSQENARYPGGSWAMNPCYAYVMYRPLKRLPPQTGYFHAEWRQRTVHLIQGEEYEALTAVGRGSFIGWNLTVRGVGSRTDGYPVDENEKFFIDGERDPSVEWQGLEDSFGFSWGFPEKPNAFACTGYQPYYNGAAAYRFLLNDRISFLRSLRVTVGFGKEELKQWRVFDPHEPPLQFSTVAYWYQSEPHRPFPPLPSPRDRAPAMLPLTAQKPPEAGETLSLRCGHSDGDVEYLADGWDFVFRRGYSFNGSPWTSAIRHCWADPASLEFDLVCPKGAAGTLRLYLLDGDNFGGGRRESISVAGRACGTYEGFQAGRWADIPVSHADTAGGVLPVRIRNLKPGSNAVVTYIRFMPAG